MGRLAPGLPRPSTRASPIRISRQRANGTPGCGRLTDRRATGTAQLPGLVHDARLGTLDRPHGSAAPVVPVFTLGLSVR